MNPSYTAPWRGEWCVQRYGNKSLKRWRAAGPWRDTPEEAERDMQHGVEGLPSGDTSKKGVGE